MLARKIMVPVFALGLALGFISFGCMAEMHRPAALPDQPPASAAASAVPEPVPVPPPSWTPAAESKVQQVAAQMADSPPPRIIATSEPAPVAAPSPKPPVAAASGTPVAVNAAADSARVRELYRQAAQSFNSIDSYIARLRRREIVGSEAKPEELLLLKFRKQPWSVYFKWLGNEGKGREAVYVKGQYENKLHTLLAAGDMPFAPAGKRFSIDPDSILVRSRSRHSIAEAGIGHIIEQLGKRLQTEDAGGQVPRLRYLSPAKRPEYEAAVEGIEETLPASSEVPGGGTRQLFFDPTNHLPVLLITRDAQGRELEYYAYDRIQYPVKLDDDDFNPDKLWPAKN
jgi:Protein of unknown function (DUF1571)